MKPIEITVSGSFRIILFYLYPHVAKVLIKQNSDEITDTCIDFTVLNRFGLKKLVVRLEDTSGTRQQVELVNDFLMKHIYGNNLAVDKGLDFAVRQMVQAKNLVSLKDIRRQLNMSERTFERRFADHVGVTPKLFARICQFHASLTQLQGQQFTKLTDIASSR